MKKIFTKKNLLYILFLLISFLIFIQFYPIIAADTSQYYHCSLIIRGIKSISSWQLVRGPSFPLILAIFNTLFGDNNMGLLIGMYIIYILTCFVGLIIIKKNVNEDKIEKMAIYFMYIIFVIINPIIYSYAHLVLTEMIMPLILLSSILIATKYSSINFKNNKLKYILYTLYFIFISIFTYFLKQPYYPTIFIVFMLAFFLEFLRNHNLKNMIRKIIPLGLSIICVIFSIKIWNTYLINNSIKEDGKNDTSSLLSDTIMRSISGNYSLVKDSCDVSKKYPFLTENDLKTIKTMIFENKCGKFRIYNIKNLKEKIVDQELVVFENNFTTKLALKLYLKNLIKRPLYVLDSYYKTYMATLNIYRKNVNKYEVYKKFDLNATIYYNEIRQYGLQIYENKRESGFWTEIEGLKKENYSKYKTITVVEKFNTKSKLSDNLSTFLTKCSLSYIIIFLISYLVCPFVLVYALIKYLKNKKSLKYYYITLLLGVAYGNLLVHTLLGTIVDRYIYPGWILLLIGYILLLTKNKKIKN